MDRNTSRSSDLPQPLRAVASGLRHLPGAGTVEKAAGGALDAIGAVSPRGRRMAVYAGAGVLGVAGVVEWPVALTGAAVAWLTQPRPAQRPAEEPDGPAPAVAEGQDTRSGTPADRDRAQQDSPAPADRGPGDRLTPSRHRNEPPEHPHAHEQPAKVGDTATASALKQVAEATAHHGTPAHHGNGTHGRPHGERPAG
ncbi:hypothetical protein ACFYOV_16315 [Streptomyces sp. NPDC005931]|uniref:hypothetical protein n=1 Tax=Streptomyces sp. NPDC005931 TaxID=3364737 RepID=UPI0036B7DFD1